MPQYKNRSDDPGFVELSDMLRTARNVVQQLYPRESNDLKVKLTTSVLESLARRADADKLVEAINSLGDKLAGALTKDKRASD